MIIEIEDTKGNTIGAVQLNDYQEDGIGIGLMTGDISIADVDMDYIFDTEEILIRIQLVK